MLLLLLLWGCKTQSKREISTGEQVPNPGQGHTRMGCTRSLSRPRRQAWLDRGTLDGMDAPEKLCMTCGLGGGTWEFWSRFPFTKRGVNECYKENRIVLIRCRSSLSCLDARVVVSWNIHWTSAKISAGCSTENMVEQVERESSWNFTECTIFIIIIFFYNKSKYLKLASFNIFNFSIHHS